MGPDLTPFGVTTTAPPVYRTLMRLAPATAYAVAPPAPLPPANAYRAPHGPVTPPAPPRPPRRPHRAGEGRVPGARGGPPAGGARRGVPSPPRVRPPRRRPAGGRPVSSLRGLLPFGLGAGAPPLPETAPYPAGTAFSARFVTAAG